MRLRVLGLVVVGVLAVTGCVTDTDVGSHGMGPALEPAALQAKAATITDLMAKNDWTAVRQDFDATMRRELSEEKLAEAWAMVSGQLGPFQSRGEPAKVDKPGPVLVYDTPMTFEKAGAKSRVAMHADGRLAGLFVLDPSVP